MCCKHVSFILSILDGKIIGREIVVAAKTDEVILILCDSDIDNDIDWKTF